MIYITKMNEAFLLVDSDDLEELHKISDYFSIKIKNYQHMPRFKKSNGAWDGSIKLFNMYNNILPYGFYKKLLVFCKKNNMKYQLDENVLSFNNINHDDINALLKKNNLPEHFEKRDYQYNGAVKALNFKKLNIVSPTASGKSFLAYIMILWLLENTDYNIALIVPRTSLVEQMYSDFEEYGLDVENLCARIYERYPDKNPDKRLIISTWQSIYEKGSEWFKKYGAVIGDEAHGFKATSLNKIMKQCVNAEYRIGMTGSLPTIKSDRFQIEGHFGPIYETATTNELINQGYLNEMEPIQQIIFSYPDQEKKKVSDFSYPEEIEYIITYEKRNNYIMNLANELEGNTLILFNRIEKHGDILFNDIKKITNKKVFYIHGNISTKEREKIRLLMKNETNAIIIASMGTYSTGINIPNLDNLILTHPSKSAITLTQMIGRVLRKSIKPTRIYDLVDNFTFNNKKNTSFIHAIERYKLYKIKEFKVRQQQIEMR